MTGAHSKKGEALEITQSSFPWSCCALGSRCIEQKVGSAMESSSQDQLIPVVSNEEMAADPEELERRALNRVNLYSELLLLTHSCLKNITPPSPP